MVIQNWGGGGVQKKSIVVFSEVAYCPRILTYVQDNLEPKRSLSKRQVTWQPATNGNSPGYPGTKM